MDEQIRVLRLVEFLGNRADVEDQIAASLHGTKLVRKGTVQITSTTLKEFPEVVYPPVILGGQRVG